jgi:hypothetical protein
VKKEFILDPLWITRGTYLDAEYFNYILLDAHEKYDNEIKSDEIDRFYEVVFHALNLNNLAVNGNIFTAKYKEIWNEPRITQIRNDLKKIYELPVDTAGIFKNANFVFINILLKYMRIHLDILDKIKMYHINKHLHNESEIFIVTSNIKSTRYKIWKLEETDKKDLGYSFTKLKTVNVKEVKENVLQEELDKLDDPKLKNISGKKNICFAILQEKEDETKVAKTLKDIILLNKGIAKDLEFEPMVISELYNYLWLEKTIPFTLQQWKNKKYS